MTELKHLEALETFRFNQLVEDEDNFHQEWINKKKCECVKDWHIQGLRTMQCNHYNKALHIEFGDRIKKLRKLGAFTLYLRHKNCCFV